MQWNKWLTYNNIVWNLLYYKSYNFKTRYEPFLILYGCENNDPDRLIIFSTVENIRLLVESNIIFSDETFKTASRQFT